MKIELTTRKRPSEGFLSETSRHRRQRAGLLLYERLVEEGETATESNPRGDQGRVGDVSVMVPVGFQADGRRGEVQKSRLVIAFRRRTVTA
jgi:hypothetical protein